MAMKNDITCSYHAQNKSHLLPCHTYILVGFVLNSLFPLSEVNALFNAYCTLRDITLCAVMYVIVIH